MGLSARALFFAVFVVGSTVALPSTSLAQPHVSPVASPPANAHGWNNSLVQVEYLCAQAVSCSDTVRIDEEGRAHVLEGRAIGKAGDTATGTVIINIDRTPPAVVIEPAGRTATTSAASIAVVAKAADVLAGLNAATCNGRPAPIEPNGLVRCTVPLAVGANDVVVEVSDRADNSGSSGFRIVRLGSVPALTIVPDVIGMIVGQVTTVQVHDESGLPAQHVTWQIDNPIAGRMSSDGRHVFTAKAPGTIRITANAGTVKATAVVTVYAGDRLPADSTRWQIGSLKIFQTPETQPLKARPDNMIVTRQTPGDVIIVESINESTGWLHFRERPAANETEVSTARRELLVTGGAIVLVESTATGQSALVRSGGTPWRYQSAGRIQPQLVLTSDGMMIAIEHAAHGFTQVVLFDSATGRVVARSPVQGGTYLALNVRCIKGAHGAHYVPAQTGPLNPGNRLVHFGIVTAEDREDFSDCGQVRSSFKRTVMVATISADPPRLETAAVVDARPGDTPPVIQLFEVTVDRRGARLLPWSVVLGTNPREFRVTRLGDDGTREYTLPVAGKIWLSGSHDDLAVTTDGTHLIGFNAVTGQVIMARTFPEGVRIMDVGNERVLIAAGKTLMALAFPSTPR